MTTYVNVDLMFSRGRAGGGVAHFPGIHLSSYCVFSRRQVVVDDIKAMLADRPLPYTGFDLFEGEDHNIKGQIEMDG